MNIDQPSKMIGVNKIDINDATLFIALEEYLTRQFKNPVKVINILREKDGYSDSTIVSFETIQDLATVTK